jgi:hypothetical protein
VNIIDEHFEKLTEKRKEQTEKEVEELTKDTMQIQALFYGHDTTVGNGNEIHFILANLSVLSRSKFGG